MNEAHGGQSQAVPRFAGIEILRGAKDRAFGRECCLIIKTDGEEHCFVNHDGKCANYRHAWQIRDWLEKRLRVSGEAILVSTVRK